MEYGASRSCWGCVKPKPQALRTPSCLRSHGMACSSLRCQSCPQSRHSLFLQIPGAPNRAEQIPFVMSNPLWRKWTEPLLLMCSRFVLGRGLSLADTSGTFDDRIGHFQKAYRTQARAQDQLVEIASFHSIPSPA